MKKLSFFECWARQDSLLVDHLSAVADGARSACSEENKKLANIAFLTGLLHDIGKANPWFQEKIKQKATIDNYSAVAKHDPKTFHSAVSAAISWYITSALPFKDQDTYYRYRLFIFAAILKHHGNLDDSWTDLLINMKQNTDLKQTIKKQMDAIDFASINKWLTSFKNEISFEIPEVTAEAVLTALKSSKPLRLTNVVKDLNQAVEFLLVYSSLLQADKLHAAIGEKVIERIDLPHNLASRYRKIAFTSQQTVLKSLRDEIFYAVESSLLSTKSNFYTLTAPTGSGKTIAVMNAALQLRAMAKNTKRRIIYCLPFTSIVDQNFSVIREMLLKNGLKVTSDLLLKHHHLVEISYISSSEFNFNQADELLIETWQSEIIVTTFHQLLYSFFSNKNTNLKRLVRLKDAVVILDEVQAIPRRYWDDIRIMFKALSQILNVTFILTTATKPLIFLPQESQELLTNHLKYFESLSRVDIINRTQKTYSLDDFFSILKKELTNDQYLSRMVILNQRAPVRHLYLRSCEELPTWKSFCLSTNLTPKDRRQRIEEIKHCLNNNIRCLIFTTQLIEAGVDISVDVIDRDIAPLDSIIQSAGRCNRHAEKDVGTVNIWSLINEKEKPFWQHVYDSQLIQITYEVLNENSKIIKEASLPKLAQSYFERLYKRSANTKVHKYIINGEFSKINQNKEGFVLIDGPPFAQSYFVIQNEHDQEIWDKYQSLSDIKDVYARRKHFNEIKHKFYDRIIQVFKPGLETAKIEPLIASEDTYTSEIGFISDETASMIF